MADVRRLSPPRPGFGLTDYWRMYAARGIKLPLNYFFQAHAFDLIHGTDTHSWIVKETNRSNEIAEALSGDHDMLYRCSWTMEIRTAFEVLRNHLKDTFERYSFVDIGCGKGKVVLEWALSLKKLGLRQRLVGLDYCEPFIHVAKNNQRVLGLSNEISFVYGDASEFDYASLGPGVIAYLYNPFEPRTLAKVLAKLNETKAVIVYNNPVHVDVIHAAGYETIWKRLGWHPNAQTLILRRK